MTHEESLDGLDREDLQNLIDAANSRLSHLQEQQKEEYYVVSDDWMNLGFFRKDNLDGALNFLVEHGRKKGALEHNRDMLQIQVQRWFPDEVEDLIVSSDTDKESE